MATVTGFTAERMLAIENSTVVDGEIHVGIILFYLLERELQSMLVMSEDLLTRINCTRASGPDGPPGPTGPQGPSLDHQSLPWIKSFLLFFLIQLEQKFLEFNLKLAMELAEVSE